MNPINQPQDKQERNGARIPTNRPPLQSRRQDPLQRNYGVQSPDTFLQPEEVGKLTDRVRRHAQVKVLRCMGIAHRLRPDGSIAILRAHITKVFDGDPESTSRTTPRLTGPNWFAV